MTGHGQKDVFLFFMMFYHQFFKVDKALEDMVRIPVFDDPNHIPDKTNNLVMLIPQCPRRALGRLGRSFIGWIKHLFFQGHVPFQVRNQLPEYKVCTAPVLYFHCIQTAGQKIFIE